VYPHEVLVKLEELLENTYNSFLRDDNTIAELNESKDLNVKEKKE